MAICGGHLRDRCPGHRQHRQARLTDPVGCARRSVPAFVVALVMLVASVSVAVSCVQTIAGVPPLLAFDTLGRTAASTLADPKVLGAGALLALLGTVLLLCALLPPERPR
jgi:hypothetical protein